VAFHQGPLLKPLIWNAGCWNKTGVTHRIEMTNDALSILNFGQFIRTAKDGKAMPHVQPLSPDHIEFYKNTIVRLVHAGELPESTMQKFDSIFTSISHLKLP
jgi:hypothetical protein